MDFGLKHLLPWGFIFPFLLIIAFELALSYGLDFYNKSLESQINNLELTLNQKEAEISGKLSSNEAYFVFSQVANIVEILKSRPSVNFVINKFDKIMPKFVVIKSFSFDADKQEIQIEASVNNWDDYVRFHNYISHHPDLELRSFTSPKLEENLINFSMVFYLRPNFYK